MNTIARPTIDARAHWYYPDGKPCFEVIAKGTGKSRPTTLRDARELGLLPSVTTLLKLLRKPELESWIVEQACLSVLTTPRGEGEELDAFVKRVLHEERHQDQERDAAADLGARIHRLLAGGQLTNENQDLWPYCGPVLDYLSNRKVVASEQIVVGKGYAGTVDLMTVHQEYNSVVEKDLRLEGYLDLWDFKSTKKLPDKSYPEHRLQLAAYAQAIEAGEQEYSVCDTYNVYISTTKPGQFKVYKNPRWSFDFDNGFSPLLEYWTWSVQWNGKEQS